MILNHVEIIINLISHIPCRNFSGCYIKKNPKIMSLYK